MKKGEQKNPAAVALGKLGAAKGGRARAEALSPTRRKEISRKAALALAKKLTPEERSERARRANLVRWARKKAGS